MRFCLDGSTAIHSALRIARAKTGKSKFIRFEGHYHGWLDNVCWGLTLDQEFMGPTEQPVSLPWSQGLALQASDEFILLPWNNLNLVEQTLAKHHHEVAAIITEPIMCNSSCILPNDGYLEGLRELCSKYQVTLIFDEVITGFRCGLGGAQDVFNVVPDLSVFGKAMASGYPISAIVGKRPWMELVADGQVIHAGTMNSACPLIAAAMATIQLLEESGTYDRIYQLGRKLMDGLKAAAERTGQNVLVQGLGPMFHTSFSDVDRVSDFRGMQAYDMEKLGEFVARLHDKGIRVIGRGLWYISTVHTEDHIDQALAVSAEVLNEMK
jgi:glutamate-1-semialdehyde 2,1-aminomutase